MLVEGIPLLWKTDHRTDAKSVSWNTSTEDATRLVDAELWCERKKHASDVMLGALNVPWFLSVNATRAAHEYIAQNNPVQRISSVDVLEQIHRSSAGDSSKAIASWVRGDVHGINRPIDEMEESVNESAIVLCTRGFCELKGFPSKVPLVEARSPLLKPAKFPKLKANATKPITREMLDAPCPPRAWETIASAEKLKGARSKSSSSLSSIVLGNRATRSSKQKPKQTEKPSVDRAPREVPWSTSSTIVAGSSSSSAVNDAQRSSWVKRDASTKSEASNGSYASSSTNDKDDGSSSTKSGDLHYEDRAYGRGGSGGSRGGGRSGSESFAGATKLTDSQRAQNKADKKTQRRTRHLVSKAPAHGSPLSTDEQVLAVAPLPSFAATPLASALRRDGPMSKNNNCEDSDNDHDKTKKKNAKVSASDSEKDVDDEAEIVAWADGQVPVAQTHTSFSELPPFRHGVPPERFPSDNNDQLGDIGRHSGSKPTATKLSVDGTSNASFDRGSGSHRGRRGRAGLISRAASMRSMASSTEDSYEYNSRRGDVFKRVLDIIGWDTYALTPSAFCKFLLQGESKEELAL